MATIQQYKNCSTEGLRALDLQLINQIQRIAPGVLVKFDHLQVKIGPACHPYLQAPAVKALAAAIAQRGKVMIINSAYRTIAQQAVLFNHFQNRKCGIKAAARPGQSNHNTGLALDIEDAQGWRPYLERQAWDWIGSFDPMHFDYEGQGTKNLTWLAIKAFQQLWNFNFPKQALAEDGCWGYQTYRALNNCSEMGFLHTPSGEFEPAIPPVIHGQPLQYASLRQGMKSDKVLILQRLLNHYNFAVDEDATFGPATAAAVRAFQLKHGIVADGVVGAATKKLLGMA